MAMIGILPTNALIASGDDFASDLSSRIHAFASHKLLKANFTLFQASMASSVDDQRARALSIRFGIFANPGEANLVSMS